MAQHFEKSLNLKRVVLYNVWWDIDNVWWAIDNVWCGVVWCGVVDWPWPRVLAALQMTTRGPAPDEVVRPPMMKSCAPP